MGIGMKVYSEGVGTDWVGTQVPTPGPLSMTVADLPAVDKAAEASGESPQLTLLGPFHGPDGQLSARYSSF